jgi:hypothetical protein
MYVCMYVCMCVCVCVCVCVCLCVHVCMCVCMCVCVCVCMYCNVLGLFSIRDGTLLHSKSQYTTVKHSRQLLEHTYTSDPHGLVTLTPIEFFQQDVLWQSSNTRSHSCSIKLPNTRRDNPLSSYQSACTPQRHLSV